MLHNKNVNTVFTSMISKVMQKMIHENSTNGTVTSLLSSYQLPNPYHVHDH